VPNALWEAIKIEGIFEGDISKWNCDIEDDCVPRYLQQMFIPEFLFSEIEAQVIQQLMITMKIPVDAGDNKQDILR